MKITIPHSKQKPNFTSKRGYVCPVYLVINRFSDGTWAPASFWGVPYVADKYSDAVEMKRWIQAKASPVVWKKRDFLVAKITL